MSVFDSPEAHASTRPSPGFDTPRGAAPQRTQKATSAPTWLLLLSLVCSLAAAALAFVLEMTMFGRLLPWSVAVVAVIAICGYLLLDAKARGAGRYISKSTDAVLFSTAVGIGLAAVVLTSIVFGLFIGRA